MLRAAQRSSAIALPARLLGTTRCAFGGARGAWPEGRRALSSRERSPEWLEAQAAKFNDSVTRYPVVTGACLVALDMGTIGVTYGAFSLLGISASANLAVAFMLGRSFRRFRLPAEIVVAELLGQAVPALTHVQLSRAVQGVLGVDYKPRPPRAAGVSAFREYADALRPVRLLFREPMRAVEALNDTAMLVLDRLGVAYTIASRLVGLGIVGALYALLSLGFDVQAFLEARGWGALGNVAGTWAAAVLATSAAYPATLVATAHLAPHVARRLVK
jgi:hypothetical protein